MADNFSTTGKQEQDALSPDNLSRLSGRAITVRSARDGGKKAHVGFVEVIDAVGDQDGPAVEIILSSAGEPRHTIALTTEAILQLLAADSDGDLKIQVDADLD
jgi:hypothetical protein